MNRLRKLRVWQSHIGVIRRPIYELMDSYRDCEIEWLHITPEPQFAADPFGLVRDGRLHIFFEFKPFGHSDGFIAHVEVGPDGKTSRAQPVLKTSHHLSYPFLFEFEEDLWMIPESCQAGEVMLFRCVQFPNRWEKTSTILPGIKSVDNTIVQHDGRWWLFAAGGVRRTELHVWFAATPLGPWQAHLRNPVKIGASSTRPAGTPFDVNGRLFRPAMDNTENFGRRIVVNRIDVLSPEEFSEAPVACLEPDSDSFCPEKRHTLSAAGDSTLTDGFRIFYTLNPRKLVGELRMRLASHLTDVRGGGTDG